MALQKQQKKGVLSSIWNFLWYDDSFISWILNVLIAFLLIKFVIYPGMGFLVGTQYPLVAVISGSMDHELEASMICGRIASPEYSASFDDFWKECGSWYENQNINKDTFAQFPLKHGFRRGDIILLYGKKPENINIGEIIVFSAVDTSRKPDPIIHRVIEVNKVSGQVKTKGDHNPTIIGDSIIAEHQIGYQRILGVAAFRLPYLGYVKIFAVDLLDSIRR